jgi:hypothetical protein
VAILSNAVEIADAGAFSVGLGSMVLIKTLTASSSGTLSFVHGASSVVFDSTYPIYKFVFSNIHPASTSYFQVNFRDGSTAYDATKTSTSFGAIHAEDNSTPSLAYVAGSDLAEGTGVQRLTTGELNSGNADDSLSGHLHVFNPSSTTFVKHFISNVNYSNNSPASENSYIAGYCNVTAAIDAVQFSMSSGNIDSGLIKLYGIKDS